MSFIDNKLAKEISDWEKKHPEEAEAYFKEHKEISHAFITKKIKYEEFKKLSVALQIKYKFLE